ncbi:MAG: nucleotidyltransferase domain-containing protein [Microthrixaceae bacterium]
MERREVPPSSLFRLVPEHIASRALLALANSHGAVLDEMGRLVRTLPHPPVSVIVFGSFARREADADSDIDVVVVRSTEIDEDDDDVDHLARSRGAAAVRQLSGNPVEILEVSADEAARKLRGRSPGLDRHPTRDGQVVHGLDIDALQGHTLARPTRTRPVSPAQVRAYAAKAQEFAETAASALEAGRYIACHEPRNPRRHQLRGRRLRRSARPSAPAGEDHDQVLVLLSQAGPDGAEIVRDLRRLLPLKTKAEYEPDEIAASVAAKTVDRAQRCAAVAQRVADTTR